MSVDRDWTRELRRAGESRGHDDDDGLQRLLEEVDRVERAAGVEAGPLTGDRVAAAVLGLSGVAASLSGLAPSPASKAAGEPVRAVIRGVLDALPSAPLPGEEVR